MNTKIYLQRGFFAENAKTIMENDEFKVNGSGTPVSVTIYTSPIQWIIRKTSECYPKDMSDLYKCLY